MLVLPDLVISYCKNHYTLPYFPIWLRVLTPNLISQELRIEDVKISEARIPENTLYTYNQKSQKGNVSPLETTKQRCIRVLKYTHGNAHTHRDTYISNCNSAGRAFVYKEREKI